MYSYLKDAILILLFITQACGSRNDAATQLREDKAVTEKTFQLYFANAPDVGKLFREFGLAKDAISIDEPLNRLIIKASGPQLQQLQSFVQVINQKEQQWAVVVTKVKEGQREAFEREFSFLNKIDRTAFGRSLFSDDKFILVTNRLATQTISTWFRKFQAGESYLDAQLKNPSARSRISGSNTFKDLRKELSLLTGKFVITDRAIMDQQFYHFPDQLTEREAYLTILVYFI